MKRYYKVVMVLPLIKDNDNQIQKLLEQHYEDVYNFSIYYYSINKMAELVVELPVYYEDITDTQKEIIKLLKENNYLDLENIQELIDKNDLTSYVYPLEIEPVDELNQEDFEELFEKELGE